MMRGLAAALVAVACAGTALAAGYDDFSEGMTATLRHESDRAIAAFTTALQAPDLAPDYRPAAFRGRATAYLQKDMCAEALADLKQYVALKGFDHNIAPKRIWAELCLADLKSARADFEEYSGPEKSANDIWQYARLLWQFGHFAEAAEDSALAFKTVDKKAANAPYMLLWQALNADLAGSLNRDALSAGMAEIKNDDWPVPLLDLYRGKITAEQAQKESSTWHVDRGKAQKCEADFYLAEWHLARKNAGAAVPLLQSAVTDCPYGFIEQDAARAELKRQGVKLEKD
jgi:lipoprotein NlpI